MNWRVAVAIGAVAVVGASVARLASAGAQEGNGDAQTDFRCTAGVGQTWAQNASGACGNIALSSTVHLATTWTFGLPGFTHSDILYNSATEPGTADNLSRHSPNFYVTNYDTHCGTNMNNGLNCAVVHGTSSGNTTSLSLSRDSSNTVIKSDSNNVNGDVDTSGNNLQEELAAIVRVVKGDGLGCIASGDKDANNCRSGDTHHGDNCGRIGNHRSDADSNADNAFKALDAVYNDGGTCTGSGTGAGGPGWCCNHDGSGCSTFHS